MKPALQLHRRAGFTMLEIVVVMSIMVLIVGIGFASFTFLESEDPFEKPAQSLTQMSKFAIHAAVLQHRSITVVFDKEGFGLLGITAPDGSRFSVPKGMKVMILRHRANGWEKAEGHSWVFGEQGICEPIKIRFESSAGVREMAFHPLTGTPVD